MCNIRKKALTRIPLLSALSVLFFLFLLFSCLFFLHVLPPRYWCWLAVSRSNNMAEWFGKNTVVAVRLFGGVTLEEADSLRQRRWRASARAHTGPLTDTSWGDGVSSLLGWEEKNQPDAGNIWCTSSTFLLVSLNLSQAHFEASMWNTMVPSDLSWRIQSKVSPHITSGNPLIFEEFCR